MPGLDLWHRKELRLFEVSGMNQESATDFIKAVSTELRNYRAMLIEMAGFLDRNSRTAATNDTLERLQKYIDRIEEDYFPKAGPKGKFFNRTKE